MSEVDDFLAEMLPRQIAAERALHKGDAEPRMETWSHNEAVERSSGPSGSSGVGGTK